MPRYFEDCEQGSAIHAFRYPEGSLVIAFFKLCAQTSAKGNPAQSREKQVDAARAVCTGGRNPRAKQVA